MKQKINGYSLIEILVVMTLFIVLGVVGASLFTSILRGSTKANILTEVKQNGEQTLNYIERSIRNSRKISECGTRLILKGYDYENIIFRNNSSKIQMGKQEALTDPYSYNYLTSNNLRADIFICLCTPSPSSCDKVSITFNLSQADTNSLVEGRTSLWFRTTISLRNK